jgi:hypothetical protein
MKYFLLAIITFYCTQFTVFAQEKETKKDFTYIQFDVTASITGNPDYNDPEEYEGQKRSWLMPDGVGSKLGYGVHYKEWIMLGIHSGLNWKWNEKLVAVPVYLNLGLSPEVANNTRITLQLGYGKGFALGRGNLSGIYKKGRLGITSDDRTFFIEISDYDFPLYDYKSIGSLSFGVSLVTFD